MNVSVREWRFSILRFFNPGKNYHISVTKENVFDNFGRHINDDTIKAFDSLVKEEFLIPVYSNNRIFYSINPDKINQITDELNYTFTSQSEALQPYDRNFKNLNFQFETERDKAIPNKGKYFHFTKNDDSSFWVTIIISKQGKKTKTLKMGSLNDPNSRLSRILKSVNTYTNTSSKKTFVRKNIEDIDQRACGNERQYSTAAFDIFEHEKIIGEFSHKGRSKIYYLKGYKPDITLDEIFAPLLEKQIDSITIKKI